MSIDIESYVKRFAIAQFSDNYECYEKINGLLNDEQSEMNGDALKAAIMLSAIHAYSDLQLRTLGKSEEETETENNTSKSDSKKEKRKRNCIAVTTALFYDYFKQNPQKDRDKWDIWHRESCDAFCKAFMGAKDQQYGKAQKMINMTFKYLYCFDALRNKGEYFKFCHMPLDTYTLDGWFKGEVLNWWNNEKKRNKRIKSGDIVTWSNLKYAYSPEEFKPENCSNEETIPPFVCSDCKDKGSYMCIQQIIRIYLESESNTKYKDEEGEKLSPFKAEFYIWEKEKAKAALKDLLKAAKEISGADNRILQEILSDMNICEDDCKNLNDCIGKICEN